MAVPATAIAGDAPTEESLCDALPSEALDALGPLRYDPPEFGTATACFLGAAGDGSHSLSISRSAFAYDMFVGPDAVEYSIGDRPATMFEGALWVDLGEGTLGVVLDLGDSPEAAGVDPIAYSIAVAEIVVPALETAPPADAPGTDELTPPEAPGIDWSTGSFMGGDEIQADEQQWAFFGALVEALEVEPAQLSVLTSSPRDDGSGTALGSYSAIQVTGVDAERLRSSVIAWLDDIDDADVTTAEVDLGGKRVTELSVGGEFRGYLYVVGDTAHAFTMSPEDAARILQAMP